MSWDINSQTLVPDEAVELHEEDLTQEEGIIEETVIPVNPHMVGLYGQDDALDHAEAALARAADRHMAEGQQEELSNRIMSAFVATQVKAGELDAIDPEKASDMIGRISDTALAVKGSSLSRRVMGVIDAEAFLLNCAGWQVVKEAVPGSSVENETLIVGIIPEDLVGFAFAGNSTIRELSKVHSKALLYENPDTRIHLYCGEKKYSPHFLGTRLRMPTTVVTVKMSYDDEGNEHMTRWFVGKDISLFQKSYDLVDQPVRCSCKYDPVKAKQFKFGHRHPQGQRSGEGKQNG